MATARSQRPDVKIACFGLGAMGSAMLARLDRLGFEVNGYDVNPQVVELVRSNGLSADAVGACDVTSVDVILSCVPADEQVISLLIDDYGLLEQLPAGASVIETSTIFPETVQKVAAVAATHELGFVDAGVTGGPELLDGEDSGLTLYTGGLAEASADTQSVLSSLGEVIDCGEAGNGKLVKIINNLMSWGNIAVAAEAFSIGTAAGVDERGLYEALARGGGRSNQFVKRFKRLIDGDDTTYFSVQLGAKDVRLARQVAEEIPSAAPLASVLEELYKSAEEVMPNKDIVSIYNHYQKNLLHDLPDNEREA